MSTPVTMDSILADTDQIMAVKAAKFTGRKSALAGQDPSSMPGAEKDKPIPEGSEAASKEVGDATMGPSRARSTDGAGDDSPGTRGHGMESEQAAEEPAKKPAITADANAKVAGLCNDLLTHIHGWQQKRAAAQEQAPSGEAPAPETQSKQAEGGESKTDTQPPRPEREQHAVPGGEGGTGAGGSATGTEPEGSPDSDSAGKQADGPDLVLTQEVLAKMAAIALAYDEGVQFMTDILEKHGGAVLAEQTMDFLTAQEQAAEKAAAANQGYADGQAAVNALLIQQGEQQGAAKAAKAAPAAAPIADGDDGHKPQKEEGEEKGAAPAGPTPQELWKLGQDLAGAAMGDIMGALPDEQGAPVGGEEQGATVEDLAAALDTLVTQGAISPEEAAEALEVAVGGQGGAGEVPGAEGAMGAMGAPPEMGGEMGAPPELGGEMGGGLPPPPPPAEGGGEGGAPPPPAEGGEGAPPPAEGGEGGDSEGGGNGGSEEGGESKEEGGEPKKEDE